MLSSNVPHSGDQFNRLALDRRIKFESPSKHVANNVQTRRAANQSTARADRHQLIKLLPFLETLYTSSASFSNSWLYITRHKQKLTCTSGRQIGSTSSNKRPSLIVSIILPLVFVFLLPTFKLEHQNKQNQNNLLYSAVNSRQQQQQVDGGFKETIIMPAENANFKTQLISLLADDGRRWPSFSELLLPLMRFPIDRLRLVSSGLGSVAAKEAQSDLQEEETHMQLMQPAEHRSAYLASSHQHQQVGYQQAPRPPQRVIEMNQGAGYPPTTSGPEGAHGSNHAAEQQPGDYASNDGSTTGEQTGPNEVGTATISDSPGQTSLSGGGGSSGLQTRSDLPAVRALNVKCEKNHMMVGMEIAYQLLT